MQTTSTRVHCLRYLASCRHPQRIDYCRRVIGTYIPSGLRTLQAEVNWRDYSRLGCSRICHLSGVGPRTKQQCCARDGVGAHPWFCCRRSVSVSPRWLVKLTEVEEVDSVVRYTTCLYSSSNLHFCFCTQVRDKSSPHSSSVVVTNSATLRLLVVREQQVANAVENRAAW